MSEYDKGDLERAYRQMKTIREFEERLHLEIQKGQIAGFTHLYSGQEAVAVGVCENLTDADYIASTHRGHGHCIAKGCDVIGMMKEIYGRADGLCKGKGGSMHIADFDKGMLGANAIVGGGPPIATGAAIAARNEGKGNVTVAFGGDGSCNQSGGDNQPLLKPKLKLDSVSVMAVKVLLNRTAQKLTFISKIVDARGARSVIVPTPSSNSIAPRSSRASAIATPRPPAKWS